MAENEKQQDEYELIPLSPLRRLEKRIDEIEKSPDVDVKEFFHELVDILRMNQELVDELVKTNDALRVELSRLPGKIEDLTKNLSELITYIKAAATEEATSGVQPIGPTVEQSPDVVEKLNQLVETNKKIVETNETISDLLETIENRLKPSVAIRKPMMLPPKPLLVK
jgi:predicted nuclease with TOPRIM domain